MTTTPKDTSESWAHEHSRDPASGLPRPFRVAAAVSWRLLLIVLALFVAGRVLAHLTVVVIPVAIALLLAALLAPAVGWLHRFRVPRVLATVLVLVGGLAAVGGVLTFVVTAFVAGFDALQQQILRTQDTVREWLLHGPWHIDEAQITELLTQAQNWLESNQQRLTSGAISTAGAFGNFFTGLVLALFTLLFFLYDGRRIWRFVLRLLPRTVRHRVDVAGCRSYASLVGFVRATLLVACVDALGIGIGLAVLGVPLAVPLAALVFLGAFVPIIGAVASGAVAVLIALITQGWLVAVLTLGVVLLVQQLESHVLQPLLLGRAVRIHPLGVVLAITTGVIAANIVGALLAVPAVAVLNEATRSLLSREDAALADETLAADHDTPPITPRHTSTSASHEQLRRDDVQDTAQPDDPEEKDPHTST